MIAAHHCFAGHRMMRHRNHVVEVGAADNTDVDVSFDNHPSTLQLPNETDVTVDTHERCCWTAQCHAFQGTMDGCSMQIFS